MLQPKRRQQLDSNIQELIKNGGSNEDVEKMAKDFVAKFGNEAKPTPAPRATTQKKNPVQNGVSNSADGSSGSQSIDPKTGFPKIDTNGPLPDFEEMKSVVPLKTNLPPKGDYAKKIADKAFSEYDSNLTEERLQTEKEQSGVLNNVSKGAKAIWNVTGEALGAINETFGGDSDYFTIDKYKPLEDEKKQYLQVARQQGLPVTEEAIQKGAEAIFRKNDRIQQVEKRIDAALPEDYDRQGIWKDLKLDNLKKNDKLRSAVASIDIYQTEVEEFNKYAAYVQNLPKEQLTQAKIDKHNNLLDRAKQGTEALEYYRDNFPKLLEEVKSSDELLDVMKYNYNDYEKHYSNIKNFLKTTKAGTLKIAAETISYIDQKTDDGTAPTSADKTFKKVIQAAKDVANDDLDDAEADRKQYAHYKAKDINDFSDFGSYLAQLATEQAPIWATLAIAPTTGLALMGTQSAGTNFRNMEKEEMQPFAKTTSFGQKLATSYLYGFAEAGFERIGTVSIIKNMQRSFAKASLGTRKLMQDSALKQIGTLGKQLGFNYNLEGGTEYLTAEAQIQADRYVAGKDISAQQANERRSESYIAGGFMGGGMTLMGGALGAVAQKARLYSDGKDIKKTQEILSKIKALDDEIKNNPNLTKEDISIIHNNMNDLMNESFDIVNKNAAKSEGFGRQENIFLVKINTIQEGLKAEFEQIKNSNLSKEQKEKFTKELNDKFNSLENDRNTTLKGDFASIPDSRKNIAFEKANHDNAKLEGITPLNDDETGVNSLPLKEREAIKKQAMDSLIAELNPDGKKDITITDEQVVERANEIYKNEQTPTQQAEAEKVAEVSSEVADVEKEIKELEDIRDNGQPLKPLMFEEDYSQEELDNAEKKHQRDVKEHISDLNKQIAKKQSELESLNQATPPVEDVVTPQEVTDEEFLNDLDDTEDTSTKNKLGEPTISEVEEGKLYEFKNKNGIVAGIMISPTEFRIDGINAFETGKGKGTEMFEDLIDYLKSKGVTTITTKSAGEGAVKMHQKAVDKGLLTEVSKNGREAVFNINKETQAKETLPEITPQEYLDFVENDFISDERLNDVATKVRENKDLNNYEKRIAKEKEKEILALNKKVQDEANEANRKAEVDTLSKIPAMEKDEFLEYTDTEKASQERINSIAYKNANNVELNNFEKRVYQDNKKVVDKLNKEKNLKENILDKVPTEQKYKTKGSEYTVAKNGSELELYDNSGQPVTLSPKTKQKYFLEALENGFMKRTEELQIPEGITEAEIETFEIENETDPSVLLEKLLTTDPKVDGSEVSDAKEYAIALYINKVTQSSFVNFSDKNNITRGIALTYFSKEGSEVDTLAQEISGEMVQVEPQDIVDFILANPNGKRNILTVKNPIHESLIDKFVELTGFRPTPSQIAYFKLNKEVPPTQIDFEFANKVEVNDETLELIDLAKAAEKFDKWFSSLTPQEQVEFYFDLEQDYPNAYYQQRYNEQQEYEQSEKITSTQAPNSKGESKPDGSVGKNTQQAGQGSRNNNVPGRNGGETQNGERQREIELQNLQKEYESKTVEELVALKKKLYPNPDIESPMSPEEKLLDKVIAKKFSEKNQEIRDKREKDKKVVESHKGKIYQNPKDGYYYEVTGYNAGIYTLKDAETGKVSKEKEVDFKNNFIDVTNEIKDKEAEAKQEEAEPKQSKRKIRDEKAKEEIDNLWAKFKKGGNNMMMGGIDPEKLALGIEIVSLYAKQGIYKFSDIIEDAYANMGEELKDLFNEIKDVYSAFYNRADDNVADQMDGNIRSITYESIINKIQNNEQAEQPTEQPITDTKPIELKTKAIESKTDKLANDREAKIPTERKLEIANDLLFDIDSEIENVNDQLRLLGFYEPNKNDAIRENPHIYIEREVKKDLTNFVKKLNERLKWEFDTDRKGKPQIASANIAPAGGDGTFILWAPNSEYGIYVSLSVEPKEYKDWYEQYELGPSIMWRVTTKKDKYRGLSNQWMNKEDFTIPNLVDKFNKAVSFYLKQENGSNNQQQPEQGVSNPTESLQPNSKRPSETTPQEVLPKPSAEQGTGSRSQSPSNPIPRATRNVGQSSTGQGDLFSGNANFLEVEQKQPAVTKPKVYFQGIPKTTSSMQALLDENGNTLIEGSLEDVENFKLKNKIPQENVKNVDLDLDNPNSLINKFTGNKLISNTEVQIEQINQAEKQEPALVDFSLQDNEQDKFNATKKYTDNINALETLLTVIKEKRKATPEEKNTLAKYIGFGGLKEIGFNPEIDNNWKPSTIKYREQVRRVIELTSEIDQALGINDSLKNIRAGISSAFYTPKTVVDTMFNVLQRLGFQNGNILEPSAGIGNFIGYMPSKMRSNSKINAVEIDNVTGNILKYLYDDVNTQIKGLQNAIIPDNSQDVIISNIPFGTSPIFDKKFKNSNKSKFLNKIHSYFFVKALDQAREGGIIMFVTSKGILDTKENQNVREYLNQNADFLGAVRLPSTAFQNSSNTAVVTDVIILRKNTDRENKPYNRLDNTYPNPNFLDIVEIEVIDKNGETKTIEINKFFADNKELLLGEIVPGGMYSEKDYSLIDPNNTMQYMGERLASSNLRNYFGTYQPSTNLNATNRIETDQDLLENTKIGNLTINKEGKILKRLESEMQEVSMPSYVKPKNVKKYIDVRVALFDLIFAEYTGQPDSVLNGLRTKLNTLYLNAVQSIPAKEFTRIATEDGDGFNVLSLTDKTGKRADILSKRTINPLQQKQNTDNVEEAIIISLYENAHIDMDRIADLMNKPVKEILELAKGKIFESPTGGFFTRDEYLSGNVKKKLAEVNKAIKSGYSEFENNKTELEAVIPKDIPAVSIEVRLGSRWVPLDIINDFADHLFKGDGVEINYAKSTDTYNNNGKVHSVNATEKWGTKRKNGADLLVDALHAATPAIYDTIDDKRVLNKEETEKAVQKFEEIRGEFENWVYTNAERRERLGAVYNEKYNTTVRRKYDGSHLNIPGINGVNLYPHQKDAIWMLLQNNGGIIDHIVGAGKTFIMVAGTAEMKRTGVAKKPMILALKSTIPQIVETYKQSYPLAKILAPSEKDFQSKNRQKLFSQISLNDWDVVIMSHENFNAIPHRIENLTKQIDDEIAEIEEERDALSGDKKALSGLETRLKNLQARLEKLTDIAKDNSVKFQEMGIDHVMVDESQQFKNLAYMTKQRNVAGLSKAEGSRRAFNLLVGMRYLQEVFGADKGTTFLSGTPISNSMVEMYSLLKYMRPNKMKELGFNTFDQWATTFASPTNEVEYTVTGQFKSKTRFREFINVPELSLLYNEIADVRNDSNLVLDKPKMKGGGYTTMFIPMNEEQADYGQRIIQFAKTKDGRVLGLELSENQLTAYMLLATNLSSKMAIDMRLINKDYAYDPNGKVGKMTDEAVKVYNETNQHKGTQLIFSDLGTPKNKNNQSEMLKDYMEDELGVPQDTLVEIFGNFAEEGHRYQTMASIKQKAIDILEIEETDFEDYIEQAKQSGETFNLYSEIKKRLIEKGIPENEIVFIHSYNNQKAKEKLFELVNAGEIRVILGSTQKLGTGVNVQKRLAAIHHLDVPWRPSDMEQRNGRGVRQGNWIAKNHLNNEIAVYAYATERTLDGYKYQLLQTKQRFLDQVKNGDIEDRVIKENSEEGSDAYAIFVAELSGNKDILLKFKLEQEKERLTKQRRNFEGSLYEAQGKIRSLESNIPAIEENVSKTKQDIESITNKSEYEVTKDKEGVESKKLKINNINGEILQPEKDSKEAKENKPVDRVEYGKKAIDLIAQTIKTIKLGEFTKSFDINGLPILVKVTNQKEMSNGKEFVIQKTVLAILSPSGQTYTVNNSTIAGVLLNHIQKTIESIPAILEMQEKVLDKNKKDLAEYKELAKNDKFPKEEELSKVAAELKEIDKRIQDFEKDVEDELEFEEKPQDNKIRIGDVVYPNFNEDVDVSMVEGKNLKTNEANFLVKINKQLDYSGQYKKAVEPLMLENFGEWNKSNKAIIFNDKSNAEFFVKQISKILFLENDLENIINEPSEAYENNRTLALNKTQDGQEFLSLSEPGSEYSNSSQPNLWQQGDTVNTDNNRRSVRAVWTKYKNLQFKGTTKIQSAEDVAQIMSLLENKHNEHAFAIHIDQKGNSHIQFLSIGGVTGTVVDFRVVTAGVAKFNSKKVYLVHNHPSGNMQPSNADMRITKNLRDGLNPLGITVEHIIMDTYLKQYIHIDNDNLFTVNTRGENTFTKSLTPVDLSEQEILGNHFGQITGSDKAFSIIQNFRFSAMPKNAMLVMNNSNQVIGNYVFSNGDITYKEILTFIGDTATATSVIFYGNQANNLSDVKDFQRDLAKLDITVFDKIVTSSNNDAIQGYYESMADQNMLNEHQEKYGTGDNKFNEVNEPSANKDLRLPQTIARQAITQWKEDLRNKVDNKTKLSNAIGIIQNTDWYNDLDSNQQARVNNTTVKSLLDNAIKELNYLEDKVQEYKEQIRDKKITARQVFDDIIAFLKTNQIKGRITPTEINRLLKAAAQITIKRDTEKALDDFMNLYEVIKEKALLRSDKGAREKAEVEYVIPIVESLVESGYDLQQVLDYFETISQKRMAEIQYHKEKSKFATEEERVNKAEEALKKQKQDLFNATYTSFREGLKKARLYWFNLIADRSYVPAELMSKTGMQQTYYQFKNTKGYGHSAKEMYEKVYDKVWKGLSQDKIQLLNDTIQMMRIITIDNNREQNGLAPVQHPNNLSKIDAQAWLDNQKLVLGQKEFNDIQKRAKEYFKAYTEVLDLKMENGFISDETYEALNGLDYQPRMFLHHAVNFDGDLSFEQTRSIETRSGLSKEQVLKLDDGSANSLISDAQWLLSNSISTLYQDIADNNLNKLFIAKEFPIAQAKYNDLIQTPISQLNKEEQRFVKYFKELSDKVIPNEIIGFSATDNSPVYKNEAPKHFVNKYYWDNGVKHQFFMEEKLATEFDGAKGLFLNETNKQVVGNLTGARLVKYFATGNNPLFVIVNTPRDFMWNIQVSEHYSTFIPLAMGQMTYQLFPSTYDFIRTKLGRENTDMNLYLRHGGSMDYLHKQGDIADKSFADKYIVKTITSVLGKNNQPIVEDKLRNNYIAKVVGALNEWSELAFRIATFRRSINAQLKELGINNESEIGDLIDENGVVLQTRQEILDNIYRKATYDARSILDFSQGGRLIKDMEEFVPYLNVGVQATRSYADAMKKRPISTTLKTFQIATGGAAAFIALAMFMLAGDDDEPEEEQGKTVERKYVEFMQGVSEETRSKYYLIPTKQRDEKGNRIAYKIAKDQFLIPYTNIVETLIENRIRTRAGFKEVSGNKIGNRLYKDIFEYNLSAKTIKDVPLFKAGTAWYAGYDLYRNKPLDKYAKAEALEGMDNPQVEDFYKHLGAQWKVSPIRTKSAIESMITSPQSNPYLATGYEVMDYAFTDKSMEHLGKGVKEMLLKGVKNRTTTKSTEWTRAESLLSDKKKEQLDAMLKEEATRQLFKDKAQEVIDGKATADEVVKDLQSQYGTDPNYRSYMKSFKTTRKSELRVEGTDGMMQRIKREKSPGAKAIMIKEIYGDINSPENAEIKQLLIGKRIINNATMRYLNKKTAN